jgi:hypothetical protein
VRVPKLYRGLDRVTNRYEAAFIAMWRHAKADAPDPDRIEFSKEDIAFHGKKLRELGLCTAPLDVKNIPDIIYTFRARADLPAEILATGHWAIIGRGKGLYAFVKIPFPNRFRFPETMTVVPLPNSIPDWVRPFMQNDEQGMLTSAHVHNLVARHLGLASAFRLQSHLRYGVAEYGQVEVDELYIGKDVQDNIVAIAVEAKDRNVDDCLNVSQLFGTAQALRALFPDRPKRLLGAKPDGSNRICLSEFAVATAHPAEVRQLGQWAAYELQ